MKLLSATWRPLWLVVSRDNVALLNVHRLAIFEKHWKKKHFGDNKYDKIIQNLWHLLLFFCTQMSIVKPHGSCTMLVYITEDNCKLPMSVIDSVTINWILWIISWENTYLKKWRDFEFMLGPYFALSYHYIQLHAAKYLYEWDKGQKFTTIYFVHLIMSWHIWFSKSSLELILRAVGTKYVDD